MDTSAQGTSPGGAGFLLPVPISQQHPVVMMGFSGAVGQVAPTGWLNGWLNELWVLQHPHGSHSVLGCRHALLEWPQISPVLHGRKKGDELAEIKHFSSCSHTASHFKVS